MVSSWLETSIVFFDLFAQKFLTILLCFSSKEATTSNMGSTLCSSLPSMSLNSSSTTNMLDSKDSSIMVSTEELKYELIIFNEQYLIVLKQDINSGDQSKSSASSNPMLSPLNLAEYRNLIKTLVGGVKTITWGFMSSKVYTYLYNCSN